MRFSTKVFFSGIACVLSIVVVFITVIDICAFNRSFYAYEYKTLDTAASIGMEDAELFRASDALLDYLQNKRSSISMKTKVNGGVREVYSTREKKHMVDVKNLYQGALLIRNVALAIVVLLWLLLMCDNKKEVKEVLTYTYERVFVVFIFALSAIVLYAISDFNAFWTAFHRLLFTNDLWLLDPDTSLMINMFPSPFFTHLVFLIAGVFASVIVGLFIYSVYFQKKCKRNNL